MLDTIEKIKKFVFYITFTCVCAVFISIYIGFLMPTQMPKLHKSLYQTLCNGDEEVNITVNRFSLPGEIRISNHITCTDSQGNSQTISEFKSFMLIGFLYPLVFSFLLSLIISHVFFKNKQPRHFR